MNKLFVAALILHFADSRVINVREEMEANLTRETRIVNGIVAKSGQFPWQTGIFYKYSDRPYCGGSLITPNYVLTAAHCIYYTMEDLIYVKTGMIDLEDKSAIIRGVDRLIPHEKYNKPFYDIGLIKLHSSIPINPMGLRSTVNVARLPEHHFVTKGDCIVSGWGRTATYMPGTRYLLYTSVSEFPHDKCEFVYQQATRITSSMLCYGGGDKDSCQGDSGGPLMCRTDRGLMYLAGLVSFGVEMCAYPNIPGVYTSTASYKHWIEKHIEEEIGLLDKTQENQTVKYPIFVK